MELKFYHILKADAFGEQWTPKVAGAKPIQSFWCQFEGVELPVMVSKQVPSTPSLTYGQFGYLVKTVSQKGTEYYKFKGQKAPEELEQPRYAAADAQQATSQPAAATVHASDQKDTPLWFAPYAIKINALYAALPKSEVDNGQLELPLDEPFQEPPENKKYTYGDGKAISDEDFRDIFGGDPSPAEL